MPQQHAACEVAPGRVQLAILLPITSKPRAQRQQQDKQDGPSGRGLAVRDVLCGLKSLAAGLADTSNEAPPTAVGIVLGIDEDDGPLWAVQEQLRAACIPVTAGSGSPPPTPAPAPAPASVVRVERFTAAELAAQSSRCLLLRDASDPGFPSFPVIDVASHLRMFGDLFPPGLFINQGGDPFLAELYRRLRRVAMCAEVTVVNACGGPQVQLQAPTAQLSGSDDPPPGDIGGYCPPRYTPQDAPHAAELAALDQWTARARVTDAAPSAGGTDTTAAGAGAAGACAAVTGGSSQWGQDVMTVDVLVPSYRVQPHLLEGILQACLNGDDDAAAGDGVGCAVDVRVCITVDRPRASLPAPTLAWLERQQSLLLHRLRLRFNASNMGAPLTRNALLDGSLAQLVVLLDDDVVPSPRLVRAYARAAAAAADGGDGPVQRQGEVGFAGPSVLPPERRLLPAAVLLSDVAFFWTMPAVQPRVPWAVTANMAARNNASTAGARFDPRYPKTGGGEDIDFCLQLAHPRGLLSVPDACVVHPWWDDGRPNLLRFARWAIGDGQLTDVYAGTLTYHTAPNALELLLLLMLMGLSLCVAVVTLPIAGPFMSSSICGGASICGTRRVASALPPALALLRSRSMPLLMMMVVMLPLASAVLMFVVDSCIDLARNMLLRDRLVRSAGLPIGSRMAASLLSTCIRWLSEAGRMWGHASRAGGPLAGLGLLRHAGLRFDWFCGSAPGVVVRERRKAAARAAAYAGAHVGVCALVGALWQLSTAAADRSASDSQQGGLRWAGVAVGGAIVCGAAVVLNE